MTDPTQYASVAGLAVIARRRRAAPHARPRRRPQRDQRRDDGGPASPRSRGAAPTTTSASSCSRARASTSAAAPTSSPATPTPTASRASAASSAAFRPRPTASCRCSWKCRFRWCARSAAGRPGIGFSLALAADFTIAADDARLWEPFSERGFTPDSGATWLLPRVVGPARARELLLLGRELSAPKRRRGVRSTPRCPPPSSTARSASWSRSSRAVRPSLSGSRSGCCTPEAASRSTSTWRTKRSRSSCRLAPTTSARDSPRSANAATRFRGTMTATETRLGDRTGVVGRRRGRRGARVDRCERSRAVDRCAAARRRGRCARCARADYEAWYPAFAASGLVAPTWPVAYGGLDLPPATARASSRSCARTTSAGSTRSG